MMAMLLESVTYLAVVVVEFVRPTVYVAIVVDVVDAIVSIDAIVSGKQRRLECVCVGIVCAGVVPTNIFVFTLS